MLYFVVVTILLLNSMKCESHKVDCEFVKLRCFYSITNLKANFTPIDENKLEVAWESLVKKEDRECLDKVQLKTQDGKVVDEVINKEDLISAKSLTFEANICKNSEDQFKVSSHFKSE